MKYSDYKEKMSQIPASDSIQFGLAVLWLHPDRLPLTAVSLGETNGNIVKVPGKTKNRFGNIVTVVGISQKLFFQNETVTDIILPSSIEKLPSFAFAGCKNLKNITIPKKIRTIHEGTFAGCENLENVYYEGTMDDWKKVNIITNRHEIEFGKFIPGTPVCEILSEKLKFVPGNEALFMSDVHFNCKLDNDDDKTAFQIVHDGKNVTEMFRQY